MSDVEGSRASEDKAPPRTDAIWTARMCSAVSEIQHRKCQIKLWQEDPTQLPSSVAYETWYWLWFCGLLSLALALPETSMKTEAQCCGEPGFATGTSTGVQSPARARGHGKAWGCY